MIFFVYLVTKEMTLAKQDLQEEMIIVTIENIIAKNKD